MVVLIQVSWYLTQKIQIVQCKNIGSPVVFKKLLMMHMDNATMIVHKYRILNFKYYIAQRLWNLPIVYSSYPFYILMCTPGEWDRRQCQLLVTLHNAMGWTPRERERESNTHNQTETNHLHCMNAATHYKMFHHIRVLKNKKTSKH